MADYGKKGSNTKKTKDIVQDTWDTWRTYSKQRETWATNAQEDIEFRLGVQWTQEQEQVLKARGQAPIVVNRIHPAVETAKAMLTANRPSFRVAAREDSDNKIAQVMSSMLSYMYDISDGRAVVRRVVDDYYTTGVGYMLIYQDPLKDMGKGEVCIRDVDPLDVYVDPNSRSQFFDDAENIIISRLYTRQQAKKLYPQYETAIDNASNANGTTFDTDRPDTERYNDGSAIFPESNETKTIHSYGADADDYVRGFEKYYPEWKNYYRYHESWSRKEGLLSEEEYEEYLKRPAVIAQGQVFTDMSQAQQLVEQLKAQASRQHQQMIIDSIDQGIDPKDIPPPPKIEIEQVTYKDLLVRKLLKTVKTLTKRIKMCVIIGDRLIYERVLPTSTYPIVPFCNIHTRTPYPVSDVRMVKPMQEYINKTRSLIIAHATTSTNTKILIPEGSVDMKEFEEKWAQPGVAISVDMDNGVPQPVQPMPLPNELYKNETDAKNDIDHQLGLYEMMQGNSQAAPQTYKATIALDEFGQRKIKSKLADIESGLTRAGHVAIRLMQELYTTEKVFRVVNPNNSLSEFVVNKKLVDDKSGEVKIFNDITIGKYDVIVVAGSTLPSNRFAELEFYMDAMKNGLVDRQEVLKKTEIFDMEGVMERTDTIAKLEQALKGAQEQIKKLQGDMQTRDREAVNLRKQVEVEKFKGDLDRLKNKSEGASRLFEKRLDDNLATIKSETQKALKPEPGSPRMGGKRAAKEEGK